MLLPLRPRGGRQCRYKARVGGIVIAREFPGQYLEVAWYRLCDRPMD
jgi:hypothetical protein